MIIRFCRLLRDRIRLHKAVASLLTDANSSVQIIVVDDGSTDGSLRSIRNLKVDKIRMKKNKGQAAAQNVGLKAAKGRFITFLDADDLLHPGGLSWRLQWLKNNPSALAVAGRPAGIIDTDGQSLSTYQHVLHPDFVAPRMLDLEFFRSGGAYPVPMWNYMFHKDLMKRVGPFNENLKIVHDGDYLLRVLSHTEIPVVFEPVVFRRLHGKNISINSENGHMILNQRTIAECKKVFHPLGIIPSHWHPWETGYTGPISRCSIALAK